MPVVATDKLIGFSPENDSTVLEFWSWAFADLSDDDIKGFYAEWLVHKLLGVKSHRRVSWANSDIITSGKTRIEVKSSAYWQSWKYLGEDGYPLLEPRNIHKMDDSKIRFSGLKARDSTMRAPEGTDRDFKSHFYVFALQNEINLATWNALDLRQWEFYWVAVEDLRSLNTASISLKTLRTRFGRLTAEQLMIVGRNAIVAFESENVD